MQPSGALSESAFPLEHSDYYRFWLREKEEIERHKWVLSEQCNRDIGWDYAHYNWHAAGHRLGWLRALKASGVHTY